MSPVAVPRAPAAERGIALVAAILVVMLSSVVIATFLLTTTGERTMSSNVQIAKASLYAADAGVRTQQQKLANIATAKLDSCCNAYSGTGAVITNPAGLFPNGQFTVTSTDPPFTASGTIAFRADSLSAVAQRYDYTFRIQSTGTLGRYGTRRVQAEGVLRLSANRGNFSDYLIFTSQHTLSNGSPIWFSSNTTFDGRVHTNGRFRFAFKPAFQDLVTSVDGSADFNNNGHPVTLNANNNGTIDVPDFYGGFLRGQPTVPLPTNTYNQQSEALTGTSATTALSNSQINQAIGNGTGSGTPPNGIYLPNDGAGHATGGLYVRGDLSQCRMWADTTGNRQWYQLTQGSTVRTICVDPASGGSIRVWNGTSTSGSPSASYSGTLPAGILYVTGSIGDLRGPDRVGGAPPPAVAEGTKLLINAVGDITIQRDVTLDSYNAAGNVLGIMSSSGSVHVGTGAPNDLNLDAYVMAAGSAGEFAVDGYTSGSPRGIFHLRGGMVASYYGAFGTFNSTTGQYLSGYGRDFHYDRRGLQPPFYPTTTRFEHDLPSARTVAWKEI